MPITQKNLKNPKKPVKKVDDVEKDSKTDSNFIRLKRT